MRLKSDQNGIESYSLLYPRYHVYICWNQTKMGLKGHTCRIHKCISHKCWNQTKMGLKVLSLCSCLRNTRRWNQTKMGLKVYPCSAVTLQKPSLRWNQTKMGLKGLFLEYSRRLRTGWNQTKMGLKEGNHRTTWTGIQWSWNQTKMGLKEQRQVD